MLLSGVARGMGVQNPGARNSGIEVDPFACSLGVITHNPIGEIRCRSDGSMEIGTLVYSEGAVHEFPRAGISGPQKLALRDAATTAATIGTSGSNWSECAVGRACRVYDAGQDSLPRRLRTASTISGSMSSAGPSFTPFGQARS